jgi:hypothetical protein
LAEAHQRLFAAGNQPVGDISTEEVACVLGDTGYEWTQPEEDSGPWEAASTAASGYRTRLTAAIVQGGVEVRGLIANWEADLSETSRKSLACFLAAAHARVCFVRFTLLDHEASAVSFAAGDRLDDELPDSVAAVAAACGLVWPEVRALRNDAVAEAYLEASP